MKKIKVQYIGERPQYMSPLAAGCDLINFGAAKILAPGESIILHTGLKIKLPEGYEAQVRSRSGHNFRKGLVVPTGTIDADYRGEIMVKVYNLSEEDRVIASMERIAQLVISAVVRAEFTEVETFEQTERGEQGFGSTGEL